MAAEPLELEHMIGFSASHDSSVQFHPKETTKMICYTGCLVIIADSEDPHKQEFLRGHNEEITCLCISPSGNLLASGQLSSTRVPNSEAFVIVWDYPTRQQIYHLNHLHDGISFSQNRVLHLNFSPDDHYLAGSDDQTAGAKLCVWDMQTGGLASIAKQGQLSFLCWGAVVPSTRKMSRHDQYKLYAACGSKVMRFWLDFDVHTMQYKLDTEAIVLPSSGLQRTYHCAEMHGGDTYLVAGSSAGELVVFNTETMVFRACVPVSCGGLLSIAQTQTPDGLYVYCGCGDGTVKALKGADQDWTMECETSLGGAVSALSPSADGAELLAGTAEGDVYVISSSSFSVTKGTGRGPLMASHTHPVACMSFSKDEAKSEIFASGAANGVVRLWELSNYTVLAHIAPARGLQPVCLLLCPLGVLSGWTDGAIRCHSESGASLWVVSGAHRGTVTSVALSNRFVLSGGQDGALRLWNPSSRSLIAQFSEHRGPVSTVVADNEAPHLIHSCGEDKTVVTVDLKQERRIVCHKAQEGQFRAMVQSERGDKPLLTCDSSGSIKLWDVDEADAISMLVTWTERDEAQGKPKKLNHVSLSPPSVGGAAGDFLLVSTAAGELQVWDLGQSAEPVAIGMAHSHEVSQAGWSPDGKQVVSVGQDCCICVWNFYM